jgi:polysaccharide export outer membrane protein
MLAARRSRAASAKTLSPGKPMKSIVTSLLVAAAFVGPANSAVAADPAGADASARPSAGAPVPTPAPGTYLLQPGDVLHVVVWKEQELQSEVLIRPDGEISFPLAGQVRASDRTVEDVRVEIEQRLRRLIPGAEVTVGVKSIAGNRIFIVGKVNRPGDFVMNRPTDVMQALSLAGGTTPFADLAGIRVLRRSASGQSALRFDYDEVQRGRNLEQNILLQGGDTVVVP